MINSKLKKVWLPGLLLGFGALLIGCNEPGPAEQAGAEIDEAVEEAGERLEEAGEAIENTLD